MTREGSSRIPAARISTQSWHSIVAQVKDTGLNAMKVKSSLKSLKGRHRDCKVVRRRGRVYVINKTDPRFKAKQG